MVEVPKPIAMGGKGKEILCMTFVPDGVAAAAGQDVVAYGCEDGLAHYVNTSPDAEPRVVNPVCASSPPRRPGRGRGRVCSRSWATGRSPKVHVLRK